MREIKVRGKTKIKGEWVYGHHAKLGEEDIIIVELKKTINKQGQAAVDYAFYRVEPETVGRFIERHDKNGKEVYEDDIVEFSYCNNMHKAEIVYNTKTCGFEVRYVTIVGAYGEKAMHSLNFANIENIKVIGNIHDNPELLS